jgi:UDP-N-acetylmuramyl pentapeptide phosphotransferase/UDP-N-acetylglucosamine-1-phosphate transferase
VGGIALLFGIMAAVFYGFANLAISQSTDGYGMFMLLLAAMPALLAGLMEDLTKKVSIRLRLLATLASALLACWLLGASLPRLNIVGLDRALELAPISVAITVFAVSGVSNSFNIIDGFHGVTGAVGIIMLAGMLYLAWQTGDLLVTQLAVSGIGATLGFLLMNYPTGRLFMGDGGAYFLGFWTAEIAVLIIARHTNINAWQILAICAYPVIEVLFSMYRRKVVRKVGVSSPDRLHLHTLIYRRIVCQRMARNKGQPWHRNATVACILAAWIAPMMLLAVCWGDTVPAAVCMVGIQVLLYLAVYARLVRGHWCLNPAVVLGLRPERRIKLS